MIWRAIYDENCFHVMKNNITDMCHEERLFYRLINSLHTEISVHVFAKWKRDPYTSKFIPNQGLWNLVYGKNPEKLRDLYYSFHFLLNAVRLIKPYKDFINIESDSDDEQIKISKLIRQLIEIDLPCDYVSHDSNNTNNGIYNWDNLFSQPETQELKDQLKLMFRNITTIVNCVSCDKCRMWSNIHMLGMGTALKITLADTLQERKTILGTL
uniref:Endoplasmic oxidoreductin-2 n=1 Tax=Lygus hesperus TaxID=30085 RepID=A0A0A9VYE1_LYGHE